MKTTRNCDYCNNPYIAETKYLNRGQGRYCSRRCSGKSTHPVKEKLPNTECGYCNEPMYVKPSRLAKSSSGFVFCTREHQRLAYLDPSIDVSPGAPSYKAGANRNPCPGCSKPLSRPTVKMCTPCRIERDIQLWLDGDSEIATTKGTTREPRSFVKKYLIETRGDRCEQCGWDKKAPDGRSVIQMEHKDGNALNNLIENLELLCPTCHAMTPTYGSLNRGNGRAWRRK